MAITDRLKSAAIALFGTAPRVVKQGEVSGYQRPVTPEMATYDSISLRADRKSVIKDCQKMASTDTRVARAIQKLASDAIAGGFSITVEEAASDSIKDQAQEIIDNTVRRCKLLEVSKGHIISLLEDGDLFIQIYVDEQIDEITRVKRLAAIITESNMDSEGNFPEDKPAYYQVHPWTGEKIKEFEGWQIVQVGWNRKDGDPYGKPMFAPARSAFKRLEMCDQNIVIRRGVSAGYRLHHKVTGDEEDVTKYKELNKDTFNNPMNPVSHFFSNEMVDIKELSGDTTIGQMEDVNYFEGQMLMITGVPYALFSGGRERSVNRDVLDEQEDDFYRVIADINNLMNIMFRKILDFALLLKGLNPDAISYSITWGAMDRDDINDKITRAKDLQALGYSFKTIHTIADLPETTYEEEVERIAAQVADGVIPYGIGLRSDATIIGLLMSALGKGDEENKTEALIEQIKRLNAIAESSMVPGIVPMTKVRSK